MEVAHRLDAAAGGIIHLGAYRVGEVGIKHPLTVTNGEVHTSVEVGHVSAQTHLVTFIDNLISGNIYKVDVTSLIGIAAAVLEAGSLCLGRCGEDTLGLVAIEFVGRGADSHDHLGIIVVEAGIVDGQALHAAQFLDGALGGSDIGTDVHVPVFRM